MIVIVVTALLPLLFSCSDEGNLIEQTGTVRFIEVEGGFYGIAADDGKQYDPLNLPPAFQKKDLRVRFMARELRNQVSVRQWGTIIEIVTIEPR